jgi:ubiquinone/menaquinone biosynthesis C-methylase UbiE
VDISEEMIKKANERKKQDDAEKLEFIRGDQIDIPLADNSMDVIFSRFSLCYAKDIEKAISEIKRVLKSGGELYVVTSFGIIREDSLAAELKDKPVPLLLGIGKEKVRLENYPHSLERYKKAFEAENLSIVNEQVFSAEDLFIPEDCPNRDKIKFDYVVFKVMK